MSDTAYAETETNDDFDAEFEAAREDDEATDHDAEVEGAESEEEAPEQPDLAKIAEDKEKALRAERAKRREATRRAQEMEQRLAALEAQRQSANPLQDLIDSLNDDVEDPIGDIQNIKKLVKDYFSQQQADSQSQLDQTRAQAQEQAFFAQVAEYEEDFKADHPDFDAAAKFYTENLMEDLKDAGYSGQGLQAEFQRQFRTFLKNNMESGRDPAEAVYNAAKRRGFAVDNATKKLQTISKAAKAGITPSASKPAPAKLTEAHVATLKGAAFDKAYEALKRQSRGR